MERGENAKQKEPEERMQSRIHLGFFGLGLGLRFFRDSFGLRALLL